VPPPDFFRRNIRFVLAPFLVSRALVLAAAIFAHCTAVQPSGEEAGRILRHPLFEASFSCAKEGMRTFLSRGDAGWYASIAESGYTQERFSASAQKNWAFFPLHPISLSFFRFLGFDSNAAGIISSHLWFFGGLLCLAELARRRGWDDSSISRTAWYLCLFPFSHFLSGSMTEAPFFALSAGGLLAFETGAFKRGAAVYALLCVTRLTGILLAPAFAIAAYQGWKRSSPASSKESLWRVLSLLLPVISFGSFALHLHGRTGDPLAFYNIQSTWRETRPLTNIFQELNAVVLDWNPVWLNFLAVLLAFSAGAILAKRRLWIDALICVIPVAASLSSGTLISIGRYTAVQFPIFLLLGAGLRRPEIERTVLAICALLLTIMSAGAALHITACLT